MNHPNPSRIYLLRHAKSSWATPGECDFGRNLSDEGLAEAAAIADMASGQGYHPDRIIASTALRCRQTAEIFCRRLDCGAELLFADALYNAPYDSYLEIIAANRESRALMLVGHNPTMEEVLERLAGADQAAGAIPTGYPTAGLAILDRPAPGESDGLWHLADFLPA